MNTRRFDAPTLEGALALARQELGPRVRVVAANRVRTGGLGGFFSREKVEIDVDTPDDVGASSDAPTPDGVGPTGDSNTGNSNTGNSNTGNSNPAGPSRSYYHPAAQPASATPALLPGRPVDLMDTEPMELLVGQMIDEGPSSVIEMAEALNSSPPAPRRATRAPLPSAGPEAGDRPASFGVTDPEQGMTTAGFASVLARIAADSGLLSEPAERGNVDDPTKAAAVASPLAPPADSDSPDSDGPDSDSHGPDSDSHGPEDGQATTWESRQLPVPAPVHGRGQEMVAMSDLSVPLGRLGLPGWMVRSSLDDEELVGTPWEVIAELARRLPVAPPLPSRPGSLLAVVGAPVAAQRAAEKLADEMGVDPDDFLLVTRRRVRSTRRRVLADPEAAGELRRSLRWSPGPVVAVVELEIRPPADTWGRAVLEALAPVSCWGVADASRKVEDVAVWSESIGGLDALIMVDVDGTATPAAVLELEMPVARLDGRPATPETWASLLTARMAA